MMDSHRPLSVRQECLAGMRDILPLVIGAIPFGIIFGTLSSNSGLSAMGAMAMSIFVFAGSSQFIALGLLAAGTAWPLIVLTTVVVNLRHLLYSISLMPYVRHLPPRWKAAIAFWLTDEGFAVAIARYNQPICHTQTHWYVLGADVLMYGNWILCTALGLTLGQLIPNPSAIGLDFAMSATFIGMTLPYLTTRPMGLSVAVAGLVSIVAYGLPHQLGLLLAAIAGLLTAAITDRPTATQQPKP
jgi:4-azaleucine resistance transporter AzlC